MKKQRLLCQTAKLKMAPSLEQGILAGRILHVTVYVYEDYSIEVMEGLPPVGVD